VFEQGGLSSIKPVFRGWYRAVCSSTDGFFMKMNWLECDADDSLHVSSYFNIVENATAQTPQLLCIFSVWYRDCLIILKGWKSSKGLHYMYSWGKELNSGYGNWIKSLTLEIHFIKKLWSPQNLPLHTHVTLLLMAKWICWKVWCAVGGLES
jgi:hypothetical protein